MAKFVLITLYDDHSIGLRIMAELLMKNHHESHILFFKLPVMKAIESPLPSGTALCSEVVSDGTLYGLHSDVKPWTSKEMELLIDSIVDIDPDFIGFSSRSIYDEYCMPLLKEIKHSCPGKIILSGGYGPTLNPSKYLLASDYVIFGEGEDVILEIADRFDSCLPLKGIRNLYFNDNKGALVKNPVREVEKDLDRYPLPVFGGSAFSIIDDDKVVKEDPVIKNKKYNILAGRGCVGSCSYCSSGYWKNLYRHEGIRIRPYRQRSVKSIIQELERLMDMDINYIVFLDDFLTGTKAHLLELFKEYEKHIRKPFFAYFHYDQIVQYPEIIDKACDAGLIKTAIGIQHGCELFRQQYLHRSFSNQTLLKAAQIFDSHKILTDYHLIAGVPFETKESLDESFAFVSELPMAFGNIFVFSFACYPHSPILDLIQKENRLPEKKADWYYSAMLYCIRPYVDDDLFISIRQKKSYKKWPGLIKKILDEKRNGKVD